MQKSSIHIRLEKTDTAVAKQLVTWLNLGSLQLLDPDNEENSKRTVQTYVTLYSKAIVWGIPKIRNHIIDRVHQQSC